jgi:outer membrane protein OmpA-like peptidoglycan-associated protein
MKSTNFPRFVIMLTTMGISLFVSAQTTKEVVILYNSKPVLAEVTIGGDVTKIIKDDPDFLKGFTLSIQDYGQFIAQNKDITPESIKPPQSTVHTLASDQLKTIPFDAGYATLSDLAISKLDEVVYYLRKNPESKIVLRTLSIQNEALINKNRLNSVKTYLKIRGIDTSRISFESLVGDRNADEIKVLFQH